MFNVFFAIKLSPPEPLDVSLMSKYELKQHEVKPNNPTDGFMDMDGRPVNREIRDVNAPLTEDEP